jgi:hypothetical protein
MDSVRFAVGWNLNITLFCAMAIGKSMDTSAA